jgi:hypothetical protein
LFGSSRKKSLRRLDELCSEIEIFVQVHFVRERNNDRYKFNTLPLKDDPDRLKLMEWLKEKDNPDTFSKLCDLFLTNNGKDENYICEKAGLEKGFFSKLRTNTYEPTKEEAIRVCFGLKLNIEESRVLLKSADFALTNSEKTDLVIRYMIENRHYNLDTLDAVLDKICETNLENIK